MKNNIEKTTVRDIPHLINTSCLRANAGETLETLADMLCASDRYKVYLEGREGLLVGIIQAKQIAMKILEQSRNKEDEADMLPAIAYVLNFHVGSDLAEKPVAVTADTPLKEVLELMQLNSIREIAVVDADERLVGTLEAKSILGHYMRIRNAVEF